MTNKLEKVLEYLINNEEGKAKELLHQVFIEKARSIHENLINMDEEMEMDEIACGDEGEDFRHDVEDSSEELDELADEIEAEETMAEDEGLDIDMADDAGDEVDVDMDMDMDMGDDEGVMDMGDVDADMGGDETPDVEELADEMQDLEDALAELKAEFEKLEAGEDAEEAGEEDFEAGEEAGEEEAGEEAADDEEAADEEGDEEEMDESWLSEFDDLDESVSLEKVAVPHGEGEVGSGTFAKPEANTKSPVSKAPTSVMGAKPVKTGEGPTKSGFNKETAPSTKGQLPHTEDNRRKKSTDKTAKVSKEGDNSAKLNKATSDGFGEVGKKSPLSTSPRK